MHDTSLLLYLLHSNTDTTSQNLPSQHYRSCPSAPVEGMMTLDSSPSTAHQRKRFEFFPPPLSPFFNKLIANPPPETRPPNNDPVDFFYYDENSLKYFS